MIEFRYATIFQKKIPELYSHSFISKVPYDMNVSMYLFHKYLICNVNLCTGQSLVNFIKILTPDWRKKFLQKPWTDVYIFPL